MSSFPLNQAINILRQLVPTLPQPLIEEMGTEQSTPYKILIATILSLRTKDTLTAKIAPKLFAVADTPQAMIKLTSDEIESLIYPVGFYRNKAKSIVAISQRLLDDFAGDVPPDLDTLLSLPGVGRKTANLVLTAGFGLPGICVDIHVHRISNRWAYVETKTPEKTELCLREILPAEYWLEYNKLLVTLGQNICTPISPKCSQCPLDTLCPKLDVTKQR